MTEQELVTETNKIISRLFPGDTIVPHEFLQEMARASRAATHEQAFAQWQALEEKWGAQPHPNE